MSSGDSARMICPYLGWELYFKDFLYEDFQNNDVFFYLLFFQCLFSHIEACVNCLCNILFSKYKFHIFFSFFSY
jgi:hypothetical protein